MEPRPGLTPPDYATLVTDPAVHDHVRTCMEDLNARLNRWETIKDFRILDHDMSVEADELTPSGKVRRKLIEAKYGPLLDSMYPGQLDR